MNVAVIGTRTFADWERLSAELDLALAEWGPFTVISGGAPGADTLACRWAKERGLPFVLFPALWRQFGHSAGPRRNKAMMEAADRVIAYWDGTSTGTAGAIEIARRLGKPVFVREEER